MGEISNKLAEPVTVVRVQNRSMAGRRVARTVVALLLAVAMSGAQAVPSYTITDLGTLRAGDFSAGLGINNRGQVTGWSADRNGNWRAFIGDAANGLTDLGALTGGLPQSYSVGVSINDNGQVAGESGEGNLFSGHAFIGDTVNGLTNLGTLGGSSSAGLGINNQGQVTGWSEDGSGNRRAFIGDAANGLTDLGTLGGSFSAGLGINNRGQVTGRSDGGNGNVHAFIGDVANGLTDLGTLGGSFSAGHGINDSGQVTGHSEDGSGNTRAFIGDAANGLTDLGTLGGSFSAGFGINNRGQVVGSSEIFPPTTGTSTHAFLWDSANGMQDLNDLVVDLTDWSILRSARGISDTGYITGSGWTSGGQIHAYILKPLPFRPGDTATQPITGPGMPDGLTFLGEGLPDPSKPTVVLTHGWQPGKEYWDAATGQPSAFPLQDLNAAINDKLGNGANIYAYQWAEAYTETPLSALFIDLLLDPMKIPPLASAKLGGEFLAALSFVQNAGADLGSKLTGFLGDNYRGDIHLIGHSLGAMVNAEAARILSRNFNIDQLTLLDPPLRVPGIGPSYFYDVLPKGTVEYVDNFYALPITAGLGGPLPAAAPDITAFTGQYLLGGELVYEDHSGVQKDFYSGRVKGENGQWVTAALPDSFAVRPIPKTWDPSVAPGRLEYIEMIAAESWDAVVNSSKEVYETVIDVGGRVINVFVDAADQVIEVVGETTEQVISVVRDAVTGVVEAVIDTGGQIKTFFGNIVGKVLDLAESSPVVIKQTVTIPEEAELLTFDYLFANLGDGDWLTVHFGDQLLWSFLGENFVHEIAHASIIVEPFAGQTNDLYFTLNSIGDRNAEVIIRNVAFVGGRQAAGSSVPEPVTMLLLLPGFVLLLCIRWKSSKNRTWEISEIRGA
ncbi:MAG TPA: DUF3466 family protein [Sedimenticola sp.]|nr:DUF3466 family protein [Sedimenticola sp.]